MSKKNPLQSATARAALAVRGRPYTVRLIPGLHLGYRAAKSGTGAWVAIGSDGNGGQWFESFALADDKAPADGIEVLTYQQADAKARAVASGRNGTQVMTTAPRTIDEVLIAYEADLTARGQNPYNARQPRFHLVKVPTLLTTPAATVTARALKNWRDALRTGTINDKGKPMEPATINRMLKPLVAALNTEAKVDARVAANREAWQVGLEQLPNATTAREAVLTPEQVNEVVAAAYAIEPEFGLYVQAHAEVGARSSQLARCIVADLKGERLMVPTSHKGKGRKAAKTPVPLTEELAAALASAAAGRPGTAPLFLRADGQAWQPEISDHRERFAKVAEAVGLPAEGDMRTIYALRHSSIANALLKGLQTIIVARWHDTSTAIIEKHYAAFIQDHYDEHIRRVLPKTRAVAPVA